MKRKPRTTCVACGGTPILHTGRCKPCEKEIEEWTLDMKTDPPIPKGCYRERLRGWDVMERLATELDKR